MIEVTLIQKLAELKQIRKVSQVRTIKKNDVYVTWTPNAEWTLAHTRYVPWSVWCSWGEFTPHLESQSHVNPTPLGSTSFWPFWPWSGLVSGPVEGLKIRRGNVLGIICLICPTWLNGLATSGFRSKCPSCPLVPPALGLGSEAVKIAFYALHQSYHNCYQRSPR